MSIEVKTIHFIKPQRNPPLIMLFGEVLGWDLLMAFKGSA